MRYPQNIYNILILTQCFLFERKKHDTCISSRKTYVRNCFVLETIPSSVLICDVVTRRMENK